jgi:hypothetical protein
VYRNRRFEAAGGMAKGVDGLRVLNFLKVPI